MSLFEAMGELCSMPIRCLGEIRDDLSGDNDDADAGLSIMTLGLSSIVKGIGKTIEKSVDKLD